MSVRGKDKKRHLDEVINGALFAAKVTKDANESFAILSPLKPAMGALINLLENMKKVRRNKEDWSSLAEILQKRMQSIQEAVDGKPASAALHDLVSKYCEVLEGVARELNPLTERQIGLFRTTLAADTERESIRSAINQMEEAFKLFTAGLQVLIQRSVETIQDQQMAIRKVIEDQAHTQARVDQEKRDAKDKLAETEEVNLIKGVMASALANGDIHKKCMTGTRQSVLDEVYKWASNTTDTQILWLADVAGAGKSTIAKEVAEKWRQQGCLAGQFFFSRDAEETRTPKLFFTTIAQQGLARLGPNIQRRVAHGIRKLFNPVVANLYEQCLAMFVEPIQATQASLYLVLDALDECEPHACHSLFQILLPHLSSIPHLKLFLTSRPETHIREVLESSSHRTISLRSDEVVNSKDVEFYMQQRLQRIKLEEAQMVRLIERAGGLFIWAKTVCDLLENFRGNKSTLVTRLSSQSLRQMNPIYRIALEQAIGNDREEETIEVYMDVLRTIVAVFKPVSPNVLNRLLNISESMEIIRDLRSVLECNDANSPIRFLHPTFRDFLLDSGACDKYYVDIHTAHQLVASQCLSTMQEELRYDSCDLYDGRNSTFTRNQLDEKLLQHASEALRYSCSFWGGHTLLGRHDSLSPLTVAIENLFTSNLLDWIYMVSAQDSIEEAVSMLQKLGSSDHNDNIRKWSADTMRFLRLHRNTFQDNPLKVYHQFAFAPKSSIFHQIYSTSQLFPHATVTIGLEVDWLPEVTIQSYPIVVELLSPSQDILVTGGSKEGLPVYTIWKLKTTDSMTFIHPCDTDLCSVYHISCVEKGENLQLRTGCQCGTLCIWDLSSSPHSILNKTKPEVGGTFLWWADDGSKAISDPWYHRGERQDRSPQLLIIGGLSQPTCYNLTKLEPTPNWIFSPVSGERLLQEGSGIVEILECSSRSLLLRRHFEEGLISCPCFSPDASFIVCHLLGHSITAISVEDGTEMWTWRADPSFGVLSDPLILLDRSEIIFTADSSVYVINSLDGSARQERKERYSSISLSPDFGRIALISNNSVDIFDHTLQNQLEVCRFETSYSDDPLYSDTQPRYRLGLGRLPSPQYYFSWALLILVAVKYNTISFHQLDFDHSSDKTDISPIKTLRLSPDGAQLITLDESGTINLWSTKQGIVTSTFSDNPVVPVSPDRSIEYAPDSSSALIYDSNQLLILKIPFGRFHSVALPMTERQPINTSYPLTLLASTFFPISNRILIVQSNGTITIFSPDGSTPYPLNCQLSPPPKVIRQLLISPTEELLAVCHETGLIVVGIHQEIQYIALPSNHLFKMGFSPDGTYLYTIEHRKGVWAISRLDTLYWSIQRYHTGGESSDGVDNNFIKISSSDTWTAMIFLFQKSGLANTYFLDLSDGRQIIPASVHLKDGHICYEDYSLMALHFNPWSKPSLSHDHVAYIKAGCAVVIDCSSLITQTESRWKIKNLREVWRDDWLSRVEKYREWIDRGVRLETLLNEEPYKILSPDLPEEEQETMVTRHWDEGDHIKGSIRCLKIHGSVRDVLDMIADGEQGESFKTRVASIQENADFMNALQLLWRNENLTLLMDRHLYRSFTGQDY